MRPKLKMRQAAFCTCSRNGCCWGTSGKSRHTSTHYCSEVHTNIHTFTADRAVEGVEQLKRVQSAALHRIGHSSAVMTKSEWGTRAKGDRTVAMLWLCLALLPKQNIFHCLLNNIFLLQFGSSAAAVKQWHSRTIGRKKINGRKTSECHRVKDDWVQYYCQCHCQSAQCEKKKQNVRKAEPAHRQITIYW